MLDMRKRCGKMDKLRFFLKENFDADLSDEFVKRANYFSSMDFLEYVSVDGFTISERIDAVLTVVWNKERTKIVGFKLKGFGFVFETYVKPLFQLADEDFNPIVRALELAFTDLGDQVASDSSPVPSQKRINAYNETKAFIKEEHVTLPTELSVA